MLQYLLYWDFPVHSTDNDQSCNCCVEMGCQLFANLHLNCFPIADCHLSDYLYDCSNYCSSYLSNYCSSYYFPIESLQFALPSEHHCRVWRKVVMDWVQCLMQNQMGFLLLDLQYLLALGLLHQQLPLSPCRIFWISMPVQLPMIVLLPGLFGLIHTDSWALRNFGLEEFYQAKSQDLCDYDRHCAERNFEHLLDGKEFLHLLDGIFTSCLLNWDGIWVVLLVYEVILEIHSLQEVMISELWK